MLNTKELLNGLPAQLTLQFFTVFARLEYAMKFAGCLREGRDGGPAMADWQALANRLPQNFFANVNRDGIANELINDPPRNLIVRNGNVDFENDRIALGTTRDLVRALWQVRNNLFHGNKARLANRERDRQLMLETLAVIDRILESEARISRLFHERP